MSEQICTECGLRSPVSNGLCSQCHASNTRTIAPTPTPNRDADATLAPRSSFSADPNPKTTFGDYELIEEIARGGMGVVYKARHQKLNRIAAIKMILGGRFSSKDDLQRFQIEAEAAAQLDHPGIVPVYDIGEQDGQSFFAMKYIDGGSLAQRIDEFREDPRKAIDMLAKVARAVHHAHQRGILHRDLKPANILIDNSDQPLITDLGLAKSTVGDSHLTHTGAVLGTPSYMAPEQAAGELSITTAADIFSLGAIMYELLTGRPPHKCATSIETVMSVINDTPDPPRKHDRRVDSDLELICLKCIERQPAARYDSAADLATDLEHWRAGESISIKAPSLGKQASRWLKQNQRLVYVVFAMGLGLAFCVPFVTAFFGTGANVGGVYDSFPNQPRPWLFSYEIPVWVSAISAVVLLLVIWPSIGLMNTIVTRPATIRKAIGVGVLTSGLCATMAIVLLGWLIVIIVTGAYSNQRIDVLGQAIWTPDDVTPEEALDRANQLYEGLENVPENKRADVLASRVFSEQIAGGPSLVGTICVSLLVLIVPVVYGTVIAQILVQRRLPFWLLIPRYAFAWLGVTNFGFAIAIYWIDGQVNNEPAREHTVGYVLFCVGCLVVAGLSLRRWKKANPVSSGQTI